MSAVNSRTPPRVWLLADHPRWVLGARARLLASWLPDWDISLRPDPGAPPDLVHLLYPPLLPRLRRAIPRSTPILLDFHSERSLDVLNAIERWPDAERRTLHAAGVSREIVQRLGARFPEVHYLPDGVLAADWPARPLPGPGGLRVGMVGLLAEEKGLNELLLPAAAKLGLEVVTHWRPPEPPGRTWPEERLLPAGCLGPLYQRMDIYAMLSRSEGTPMPLLEAMASGVAPIATRTGAAPELIEHGRTGFLLDERSPAALETLLSELPDRARLHGMGAEARARVLMERPIERAVAAVRRAWSAILQRRVFPLDRPDAQRVLLVVAHSDDETLWAGGTRLLFPWHRWTITCATAREGTARHAELLSVARASHGAVLPLGLPDSEDLDMAGALSGLDPGDFDWVLTHGPDGEYGHPHHRAVHHEVRAWLGTSGTPLLLFAPGGGPERVHLPPAVHGRKIALLERYRAEQRRTRIVAHAARHLPWEDWCVAR